MMNREYLQLAHNYDPKRHCIAGYHLSEKLDGMRAYWDGGISRGKLCSMVSYANTAKDFRKREPPVATGLWSRYGKSIQAPDWWLDALPKNIPLDGELYMGRGKFQSLISCVKKDTPTADWSDVEYIVFDIPSDYYMFTPGKINNPNCKLNITESTLLRINPLKFYQLAPALFNRKVEQNDVWSLAKQIILPMSTEMAEEVVHNEIDIITTCGGEGVMLRNPNSIWMPKRTHDLLKVKKYHDAEGVITGYTWGTGKLEGLMGSATVNWDGVIFDLSGFTDAERELTHSVGEPGTNVSDDVINNKFPRGMVISFKYRELTDAGVPKEARYKR